MVDPSLNTDSFRKNVIYGHESSVLRQIYHLLVMKKGTDPLNPDKGCDVNSYYYSFSKSSVLASLEQDIRDQIKTYTDYDATTVSCKSIKNKDGKYILHVIVSILQSPLILITSTNGAYDKYTMLDSSSMKIN